MFLPSRVPIYLEYFLDHKDDVQKVIDEIGIEWDFTPYSPMPVWIPCEACDHDSEYDLIATNNKVPTHQFSVTTENLWIDEVASENPYTYNVMVHTSTAQDKGLKTGDTARAGRVLLAYQEIGSRRTLSVVMVTVDHYGATAQLLTYAMTTLGPRDHLIAAALETPLASLLPEWMVPRLEAIGPLADGRDRLSPPGSTPGQGRVIDAFRDLLPPLLGGDA